MRRALISRAKEILRRIDLDPDGKHIAARDELSNLSAIRTELLALLRRDGRDAAVSIAEQGVVDAMDEAMSEGPDEPGGAVSFKASARRRVMVSIGGALDSVAAAFDDGAAAIRRLLDVSEVAGAPTARLLGDVADAIDTSASRARAAAETAIIAAHRAVTVQQAESGAEALGERIGYLYDGPDDDKIRPFCSEHVGIVYTLKALERMDNGQGLPVVPFAGGYRCRHRLSPIELAQAKAEGYRVVTR